MKTGTNTCGPIPGFILTPCDPWPYGQPLAVWRSPTAFLGPERLEEETGRLEKELLDARQRKQAHGKLGAWYGWLRLVILSKKKQSKDCK